MIDNPASFHAEAAWQGRCQKCRTDKGLWHAHHTLSKSKCKQIGAPLHDPRNALRLCAMPITGCHWRHEQAQERVPLSCLRDENIAFAVRWLGPGPAYNYLSSMYAGTDPRLEHVLDAA